jgi:hypothetical protein
MPAAAGTRLRAACLRRALLNRVTGPYPAFEAGGKIRVVPRGLGRWLCQAGARLGLGLGTGPRFAPDPTCRSGCTQPRVGRAAAWGARTARCAGLAGPPRPAPRLSVAGRRAMTVELAPHTHSHACARAHARAHTHAHARTHTCTHTHAHTHGRARACARERRGHRVLSRRAL